MMEPPGQDFGGTLRWAWYQPAQASFGGRPGGFRYQRRKGVESRSQIIVADLDAPVRCHCCASASAATESPTPRQLKRKRSGIEVGYPRRLAPRCLLPLLRSSSERRSHDSKVRSQRVSCAEHVLYGDQYCGHALVLTLLAR